MGVNTINLNEEKMLKREAQRALAATEWVWGSRSGFLWSQGIVDALIMVRPLI